MLLDQASHWPKLEEALSSQTRLQSVQIRFEGRRIDSRDFFANDEDFLRRHLPRLQDKGILSFQY